MAYKEQDRIAQIIEPAIARARTLIKIMSPIERVEFMTALHDMCCRHCGHVEYDKRGALINHHCRCDHDPEKD